MRLAGVAKAGYYPTPPETLNKVLALLKDQDLSYILRGRKALDPCAGEGQVLAEIAQVLGMCPVGVELDRERVLMAQSRGIALEHGDARQFEAFHFPLVWLNPPYDQGDPGERLETAFLRQYRSAVAPGGILVLLIPESSLQEAWEHLAKDFEIALVSRIDRAEYPRFRQAVVIAQKRTRERLGPPPLPQSLPYLDEIERIETFPVVFDEVEILQKKPRLPGEEQLRLARSSPLWAQIRREHQSALRPLTPLKPAHLALLIAGGMLDLEEISIEGVPHLLLGVLRKRTVSIASENGRVEREVYQMGIRAVNLRDYSLLEVQ